MLACWDRNTGPASEFRTLLNQNGGESNPSAEQAAGEQIPRLADGQDAASENSAWTGASVAIWCPARLCGQPEQQDFAQAPSASSMMVLMVRAQRPHSALQPRQP